MPITASLLSLNACGGMHLCMSWQKMGLAVRALLCLCSHRSWCIAQVFDDMQARGVLADVVTCCSLINALERGGQWQLAEQLFVQMCAASWQSQGVNSPLYRIMEIAAAPTPHVSDGMITQHSSSPLQAVPWGNLNAVNPPFDRRESAEDAGGAQHMALASAHVSSPAQKPAETMTTSSPLKPTDQSLPMQSSVGSSHYSMPSLDGNSEGMLSRPLASSLDKHFPLDSAPSSDSLLHRNDSSQQSLFSHEPKSLPGRGTSNSSVTQHPSYTGTLQTASSSKSSSCSPSDYTPTRAEQNQPLVSLSSPARSSYALAGQGSNSTAELLQSFSNMHVGNLVPSAQRALFPQEQHSGLSTSSGECSNSTVRRIQEAAANRQELLSLRPTTNPVGGSMGQAPVLRHMNVSQIAPNRVCCNALLAAYARAKPTLWQKVTACLVLFAVYDTACEKLIAYCPLQHTAH